MPDRAFDFVLFDLGGVLIELGGVSTMQEWTGIALDDELWLRWLTCPWVRSFEMGECSADEFSVGFVTEWEIALSPAKFLELFRDWPIGPYPGAQDVLREVQRSVPIGCLSNTNALHWDHQSQAWPMLGMFDRTFLSFELGLVKPDEEIFELVAEQLAVGRDRILYLDDVALNVEAANRVGLRAEQVRGPDECRRVLSDAGLVAG